LAARQADTHAWQPMHKVESYNMPSAPSGICLGSRESACAEVDARHAAVAAPAPAPVRNCRRESVISHLPRGLFLPGDGGLIALVSDGHIAAPFNSQGMKRAWLTTDGEIGVEVFGR